MANREYRLRRRTVLAGTSALALWGPLAAADRGEQSTQRDGFVIEQGDECLPITPLTGSDPVEAFYGWDLEATDYSSSGTTDLQRPDTSILFLYRGPDGSLALVVVHDAYEPDASSSQSGGGSVTFRVEGLPEGGRWLVRDDFYDDPSRYDVWQVDGEPQQIDWTWAGARSDGGVFGPLSEPFDVTIEPAFNEDATLFGRHYEGRITDWQVLSGDRSAPERTSLALDRPVRLRTGTCRGDAGETDRDDGPAEVDVDVVPGRVNPDSRGLLPVDLRSTDEVSVEDIVLRSVRATPGGARPVVTQYQSSRPDTVRLLFRIPDLDLSGDGKTTVEIEAETTDGDPVTGSDTVRLTPDRGRKGDDGGGTEPDGRRGDRDEDDGKGRKKKRREDRDGGEGRKKDERDRKGKGKSKEKGKGRNKGKRGGGDDEIGPRDDDDDDGEDEEEGGDDDDDDDGDGDDGDASVSGDGDEDDDDAEDDDEEEDDDDEEEDDDGEEEEEGEEEEDDDDDDEEGDDG